MLLFLLVMAIPCGLIISTLMLASKARAQHPKWWIALGCGLQAIPAAIVLREMGQFSGYFTPLCLLSVGLVLIAVLILVVSTARFLKSKFDR